MRKINKLFYLFSKTIIKPQTFTYEPYHDKYKVISEQYEFIIDRKPPSEQVIYTHRIDTPAAVLKKNGLHILPQKMPDINKSQKLTAVARQLEAQYQNAFRNCKSGKQIFHMQRKIKSDTRKKLHNIGTTSKRYQHMLAFQSLLESQALKTQQQYEKKGVQVEYLNDRVYPFGQVWMPTSSRYLNSYFNIVKSLEHKSYNVLDLGCGSGILSFLFAKNHKKSRIVAIDKNPNAVKTTNINAARLGFTNVEAIQFDIVNKQNQFKIRLKQNRLPEKYDFVVVNPPWICAASLPGESIISQGVYDDHMNMLETSIKMAFTWLAPQGKLIIIYSDLSQLIGLTNKTVDSIAKQNGFEVESLDEIPLLEGMPKKSALQQFKSKAKIQTYVLKINPLLSTWISETQ